MFGVDDVLIGAAITGGSGLLTGMFNRDSQQETNQQQMAFNAQQAELNRQFQERMSNTAYQRGMADMRAAGLNPILAYQKGGASAPTGGQASASLVAPKFEGNPVGEAINTGMAMRRAALEAENQKMTFYNIQADTALKAATSARHLQETQNAIQAHGMRTPDAIRAKADAEILQNSAVQIARKAGTAAEEGARVVNPVADTVGRAVGSAIGLRKVISGGRTTSETTHSGGGSTFNERFGAY